MAKTAKLQTIGGSGRQGGFTFTAAAAPNNLNDASDGNFVGDRWIVQGLTPAVYVCVLNTVGTALWAKQTVATIIPDNSGGSVTTTLSAVTAPTAITDSSTGVAGTTLAAIAAGSGYAQGDVTAANNAIASLAARQAIFRASIVAATNAVASLGAKVNAAVAASLTDSSGGSATATIATILATANRTALTDSTGGAISTTLASITADVTYAQADATAIKNAIASINAQQTLDIAALVSISNNITTLGSALNNLTAAGLTLNADGAVGATLTLITQPSSLTDSTGSSATVTIPANTAAVSYTQANWTAMKDGLHILATGQASTRTAIGVIKNAIASIAAIIN